MLTSTEFSNPALFLLLFMDVPRKKPVFHLVHAAWIFRRDYIIYSHGLVLIFFSLFLPTSCDFIFAPFVLVSPYFLFLIFSSTPFSLSRFDR